MTSCTLDAYWFMLLAPFDDEIVPGAILQIARMAPTVRITGLRLNMAEDRGLNRGAVEGSMLCLHRFVANAIDASL